MLLTEKLLSFQAFSIPSSHLILYWKYFHVWDPAIISNKSSYLFVSGFSKTQSDTRGKSDCCQKWRKSLDWPCHPRNCRKSWWSWRPWRVVCSTLDDRLCILQQALGPGTLFCRAAHWQILAGRVRVSAGWCCASLWSDRIYWSISHPGQSSYLQAGKWCVRSRPK